MAKSLAMVQLWANPSSSYATWEETALRSWQFRHHLTFWRTILYLGLPALNTNPHLDLPALAHPFQCCLREHMTIGDLDHEIDNKKIKNCELLEGLGHSVSEHGHFLVRSVT